MENNDILIIGDHVIKCNLFRQISREEYEILENVKELKIDLRKDFSRLRKIIVINRWMSKNKSYLFSFIFLIMINYYMMREVSEYCGFLKVKILLTLSFCILTSIICIAYLCTASSISLPFPYIRKIEWFATHYLDLKYTDLYVRDEYNVIKVVNGSITMYYARITFLNTVELHNINNTV